MSGWAGDMWLSATEWGEPLRGPDLVLPPYPTRRLHGAVELG
ncbi:MAG: hypothetical protein ACR2NT_01985 [Acidimicrobiia bacterium]